jgi:hypothetical protein
MASNPHYILPYPREWHIGIMTWYCFSVEKFNTMVQNKIYKLK